MIKEVIGKLSILLQGSIPEKIDTEKIADEGKQKLAVMFNQLIDFMKEIHNFIIPLSKGEIAHITTARSNFLASPFKELHSRLLHLTWQAKQVADGDYSQRVDFMGEFSEAFNSMIVSLDNRERQLKKKIDELENAHSYINNLEGFLPICANCKKIRIEGTDPANHDQWVQIESYISQRTSAKFSHSICPECKKKLYPDITCKDE
jgi:methyl-accepting chemotaxis protein